MKYQDFVVEVMDTRQEKEGARWIRRLDVRVARTTAQGDAPVAKITTRCDQGKIKELLDALDSRDIGQDELFELGRLLALLILPARDGVSGVRELFARNMDALQDDEGLRLRLILPAELAAWPWEYLYLDRTGGNEDTMNGFIALDPRVGIVRHEGMPLAAKIEKIQGDINVLAALASNDALGPLDLEGEEQILRAAFAGRPGLKLEVVRDARLSDVVAKLDTAQVFHFAGHGAFRESPADVGGVLTGKGMLAFEDRMVEAGELGVTLQRRNVQLAVLGGCETGRRAGPYTVGSLASGLARAEVPAVVANQFAIHDTSAKEFAKAFYSALDGGLPLERAMHAGRLAVFNADPEDRDWGVPVLYLRAPDGELFGGASDEAQREASRASTEERVTVRSNQVGRGGIVSGAVLLSRLDRALKVQVTVDGQVLGKVVGLDASLGGGTRGVDVRVDVGDVGDGGSVTGAVFGADPEPAATKHVAPQSAGKRAKPPASVPAMAAPPPQSPPQPQPMPSGTGSGGSSAVNVNTMNGGTAIGTQYNTTNITNVPAVARDPDADLIHEELRLDLRAPQRVTLEEPFDVQVQIKLPQSPPISATGDTQVASAAGGVFRREESEVVNYKVVPGGDGFRFDPPSYKLRLYPKSESQIVTFEGVATKSGQRKLRLNAYQDDDTLAAQTSLTLEIVIATAPR